MADFMRVTEVSPCSWFPAPPLHLFLESLLDMLVSLELGHSDSLAHCFPEADDE